MQHALDDVIVWAGESLERGMACMSGQLVREAASATACNCAMDVRCKARRLHDHTMWDMTLKGLMTARKQGQVL